jgi:hypothetical protein
MKPPSQNEATQLLLAWSEGDKAAMPVTSSPMLNEGSFDPPLRRN